MLIYLAIYIKDKYRDYWTQKHGVFFIIFFVQENQQTHVLTLTQSNRQFTEVDKNWQIQDKALFTQTYLKKNHLFNDSYFLFHL